MTQTLLDVGNVRDLVASLGWMDKENHVYTMSPDCLECLESLETQLLKDDVYKRNVRIYLGISEVVKTDLIPILIHCNDDKIYYKVVRLLANLTLPVECLLSPGDSAEIRTVIHQLQSCLMTNVSSFLVVASTASLVTTLRNEIVKTERYQVSLNKESCEHLKSCLLLLRNILHCPDESDAAASGITKEAYSNWQSIQSKLVWNLFVQGLDGALLLMLTSKYKEQWAEPLAQIIVLLYKDQNVSGVQHALELVSSTSESSEAEEDEESDESKMSSISLSSEYSKNFDDSGCPLSPSTLSLEEIKEISKGPKTEFYSDSLEQDYSSEIDAKLKTFSIHDTDEDVSMESASDYGSGSEGKKVLTIRQSGTSSQDPRTVHLPTSSRLHHISASLSRHQENISASSLTNINNATTLNFLRDQNAAPNDGQSSSSGENCGVIKISQRNATKLSHKQRNMHHSHIKVSESDSSNEDTKNSNRKSRIHLPSTWKGKSFSSKRSLGCAPSICMDAALNNLSNCGRLKYPLWEKRNAASILLDKSSNKPSQEDIGNLLKDFTLSFLHSGFKSLIMDIKELLTNGEMLTIDKCHFLWLLSYFLHFAKSFTLNLRHINDLLSLNLVGYLIYESTVACEEIEMSILSSRQIPKHLLHRSHLLVTSLKEVVITIYEYSNKVTSANDRLFFQKLCCNFAETQEVRQLPLLLFHNYHSSFHSKQYLEDLVILNHHLLMLIERGSEECLQSKKINTHTHLKQFATQHIMSCYGRVLEGFMTNSHFLNDCVFTMMHHIAGDINAPELLMQPLILKTFSCILKEDLDLPQFWEDLIMYVLNMFSHQVAVRKFKSETEAAYQSISSSHCNLEVSSSNASCISSNSVLSDEEQDDELFWWYLQFETNQDPVAKISEHIMVSEEEVLQRLYLKGIISVEKYKELEGLTKAKNLEETSIKTLSDNEIDCDGSFDNDITQLLRKLVQAGHHHHLTWIQDQLLEACSAKHEKEEYIIEPVTYYSCKMRLSVPLVPYNDDQRAVLQDQTFLLLLQKLGLFLGRDLYKLYPRIPIFWSTEVLYMVAARMGPIKKEKLKFQVEDLTEPSTKNKFFLETFMKSTDLPPFTSCTTLSSWLGAVQQSKSKTNSEVMMADTQISMGIA